jgi:hypothetical protein
MVKRRRKRLWRWRWRMIMLRKKKKKKKRWWRWRRQMPRKCAVRVHERKREPNKEKKERVYECVCVWEEGGGQYSYRTLFVTVRAKVVKVKMAVEMLHNDVRVLIEQLKELTVVQIIP